MGNMECWSRSRIAATLSLVFIVILSGCSPGPTNTGMERTVIEQEHEQDIESNSVEILVPELESLCQAPKPSPVRPVQAVKPEPKPVSPAFKLRPEEQQVLALVNTTRKQAGLNELSVHRQLTELARLKSKCIREQFDNDPYTKLSHYSPTYGSPFDMIQRAGITYQAAAENLALYACLDAAHQGLMNSDGHRKNILNPVYTHIGIGVVQGDCGRYFITQLFLKPN